MKVVITRFKDGTFVVSDGWEMHMVPTAEEASAIVAVSSPYKYKNVLDLLNWSCQNNFDMVELSKEQTVSKKIVYEEMF
jgi:hypothetical protein